MHEVVSPSLLALDVDVNEMVSANPQFDLGMGEWLDSENLAKKVNEAPPPKRMHIESAEGESAVGRFEDLVSTEQLQEICKGYMPKNTEKNTKWAMSIFNSWVKCRNERVADTEKVDADNLAKPVPNVDALCTLLSLFLMEV